MTEIDPIQSGKVPTPPPPISKLDEEKASSFQKFLGPSATKEQIGQFINQWAKDLVREMRKAEQKWKESMNEWRKNG